jgi:ABC-type Zn uptake system ZnuABC Zn-binding protein ZnuA
VDVVTTTPELAAIAREVGGNLVRVTSLAKPDQDYHRIEARPTDVVRIARADVFVRVGMDLDMWADALMASARSPRVQPGGAGYVDASRLIRKKGVPTERITGASGDVHPMGNPQYWTDPANGKVIAYQILLALRAVDRKNAGVYDANYKRFAGEVDRRLARWQKELAPYKGKGVVAFHEEWVYFLDRFGLRAFGYLEPRPGIPPSGAHVSDLIRRMKASGVKAVVVPSVYPMRYPNLVAKETGGTVEVVPYSAGSRGTKTYFDYIDAIVNGFRQALG